MSTELCPLEAKTTAIKRVTPVGSTTDRNNSNNWLIVCSSSTRRCWGPSLALTCAFKIHLFVVRGPWRCGGSTLAGTHRYGRPSGSVLEWIFILFRGRAVEQWRLAFYRRQAHGCHDFLHVLFNRNRLLAGEFEVDHTVPFLDHHMNTSLCGLRTPITPMVKLKNRTPHGCFLRGNGSLVWCHRHGMGPNVNRPNVAPEKDTV